ncbi:hypothetical protein EHQ52_15585 [Leptospira koniambonensis]|uniref:Uncharacterized protein n=1 Tax=Leptospira koniambonensis TaxID=2484950 RepID=A0A4R9J5C2_9LEPT|nr:hypothetical protein [Leptospira koniambonensis]TGL31357.1 hypothetical protein EHQ52_15585 [Leptospira koniambonensis]
MFNFFKNSERKKKIELQDNETQERLIEALLLTMYADGKIKVSENDSLEKILDSVAWHEAFRYRGKFGEIISKVRSALENDLQLADMIRAIVNLDDDRNGFIIECCEELASSDKDFDGSERSIIERMRKLRY